MADPDLQDESAALLAEIDRLETNSATAVWRRTT
jgi:hypothetical protein